MRHNRNLPKTQQVSAIKGGKSQVTAHISLRLARLSHIVAGASVALAAIATSANLGLVQLLELQTQSLFLELRGPVNPPDNIVILAIDESSLSISEQYYQRDPQAYSYLATLQAWPWKRAAYAQVVDRLMAAGARAVALDVLFASPSSYGTDDDHQFAQVLNRYAGRVTLAAEYEESQLRQGNLVHLIQPEQLFWTKSVSIGSVNFPLEADHRIHKFASEFPQLLAQKYQNQSNDLNALKIAVPSFEQAVVATVKGTTPTEFKGKHIYFYGPAGTFEHIPFWHVLDPVNWNTYLKQGKYFKDKVVIIGATAGSLQDFHRTPFSQSWLYPEPMPGVEIQANAIATLLENKAITQAIPDPKLQGLFVLVFAAGAAVLFTRPKRPLERLILGIGIAIIWGSISYCSFVYQQFILPTALPIVAIALSGCSYSVMGAIGDNWRKLHLRRTLERYASFPVVQEIISQQEDLQDLLLQRELATVGKLLGGRYKIVRVLGSGGFSETYVAEDIQRPSNPRCVVKQLRPSTTNSKHLQLARRLFQLEAETLEKLGTHNQIPQLYAYFEQDEEFYLVQELIVGHPLSVELKSGKPISETTVIQILQELLQILEFVHSYNVVHRDIKPSNIMRRHWDSKLVLIDFGAVKEISTQLLKPEQISLTVGIGTQGYAASEQYAGRTFFSSDIYAVGMIGITALTGLAPHELEIDAKTGEYQWQEKTQVSSELADILRKMLQHDFSLRYQTAAQARSALDQLVGVTTQALELNNSSTHNLFIHNSSTEDTEDLDATTQLWIPDTKIPNRE